MNRIEFGRYLLKHRSKVLGVSLVQLSEKSGLSIHTLTNLERGGTIRPEYDTIEKASKAYGISKKMFNDVFFPDLGLEEENKKADMLLQKIQSNKIFKLESFNRDFCITDYELPLEVKKYIISMYEKLTGEKLS